MAAQRRLQPQHARVKILRADWLSACSADTPVVPHACLSSKAALVVRVPGAAGASDVVRVADEILLRSDPLAAAPAWNNAPVGLVMSEAHCGAAVSSTARPNCLPALMLGKAQSGSRCVPGVVGFPFAAF